MKNSVKPSALRAEVCGNAVFLRFIIGVYDDRVMYSLTSKAVEQKILTDIFTASSISFTANLT